MPQDKLTAVRIKQQNGQYGPQIPVGAKAENVKYDNMYSVKEVLGNVKTNIGPLQEQIDNIDTEAISGAVTDWLEDNPGALLPTDKTLSIADAPADAQQAGKVVTINDETDGNATKLHLNTTNDTVNVALMEDLDNLSDVIAEEFATNKAYAIGQYVFYGGNLYKFTAAHSAGAWDSSQVTQVKIGDEVSNTVDDVDELKTQIKDVAETINIGEIWCGSPIKNEYVDRDSGDIIDNIPGYERTDFIEINPEAAQIIITSPVRSNYNIIYNENKEKIVNFIVYDNYENKLDVKSNWKYIVLSGTTGYVNGLLMKNITHSDQQINNLTNMVEAINNGEIWTGNPIKNEYVDRDSGDIIDNTPNYERTDFIEINSKTVKIIITSPVRSNYNIIYNENKEKIVNFIVYDNYENKLDVKSNWKYIVLSGTTGYVNGLSMKNITLVDKLVPDGITNVENGIVNFNIINNSYVDNISGDFLDYNYWKRTDFINIKEYQFLYFESAYRTPFCMFYDANKNKKVSFIIQIGETLIKKPDGAVYCAFSASNSQFNTIKLFDATTGLYKSLGFANRADINLKYLDRTDILIQMVQKPLFLVYTDIHAAQSNFNRMANFYNNNLKSYTKYPICLGDMVADQETEDISWMNTDFGKASYKVIGNHDVLVSSTLPGVTELEAYNKFLKNDISNWNVIQPDDAETLGLTYYYKDTNVSTLKVRMIILDEYYYTEAQHNWFVSVLNDAKTNSIPVIVCQHQSNVWNNQASPLNSDWAFATPGMGFDLYRYDAGYSGNYQTASENRVMAVDDFIASGGEFICWMSGHTHSDQSHTFERNNRKQLSLVFSNAGMSMTSSYRIQDYSSDCFQYVAFDTSKKYVYVLRIGESVDKWFHRNLFMVYDYANHSVVEYH